MREAPYKATRSQQVSSHHTAQSLWSRWMVVVLCVIMDIHPGATTAGLMELRLGGYCAMFRPISLAHIPPGWRWWWGWRDPNETPAFPRCQWARLLHSVRAGERGHPSVANGLGWKNTDIAQAFTLHAPLHPGGHRVTFSEKFRHEQLRGIREWQVYSRSQRAHRREADWQSSQVEAAAPTERSARLSASPAFIPLRGFSRQALLRLPACLHIITAPSLSPLSSHFCCVL